MGSPLCLRWLMLFLDTLRRTGYKIVHLNRRYVDDTMMLFYLPRQNIQKPYEIFQMVDMLTCHLQLKVKSKTECPFLMYRLVVKIKHLPPVYCKPTFSGVYTHFDSFLPSTYKFGTVYILAYRSLQICSSWTKLHNKLVCLKGT